MSATKVESFMDTVTVMFKLAGFSPWFNSNNVILKKLSYAYIAFAIANCSLNTVLSACNFFVIWDGKIFAFAFNMLTFVLYITTFILLVYFNFNRKCSRELIEYVSENFQFSSARGLSNINMTVGFNMAKYASLILIVCGISGSQYWAIVPLVSGGPNGTRLLPSDVWYPIDMTSSPYYELAFLSSILGQLEIAAAFTAWGCSSYYIFCCILTCGQLNLLCCSLRNIRFNAILRNGVPHNFLETFTEELMADEKQAYFCGESEFKDVHNVDREVLANARRFGKATYRDLYDHRYDSATQEALKECIRLHQMILEFITKFEQFSSPILLLKLAEISIFLCVFLYATSVMFSINIIIYGMLATYDLLIPCYCANQVSIECGKVTYAAFGSPWWCCDRSVRTNLSILITSSSRPKLLKVFGFYGITLYTFLAVGKASFSYYTVLTTIK